MASAKAPTGDEQTIRVIVFREADQYVAQCLEYDIATQAPTLEALMDRLELTLDAEFAYCEEKGIGAEKAITPAPNYYHDLWEARFASLARINVAKPDGRPLRYEMGLAKAA